MYIKKKSLHRRFRAFVAIAKNCIFLTENHVTIEAIFGFAVRLEDSFLHVQLKKLLSEVEHLLKLLNFRNKISVVDIKQILF